MSPSAEALITARRLTLRFDGREVLQGIDLTLSRGEIVTVIGPNGAGKSTLLRVILGLLTPDEGEVLRAADLTVGYLPQRLHIDPTLPLTVRRFLNLPHRQGSEAVTRALGEVSAGQLEGAQLHALSGGEFQRVLLARALLREPNLLVLDEPAQGVDYAGQAEFFRLIDRARRRLSCGVLMVSHDLHLVMAATDRVICLNQHVCCTGAPEAVSRDPNYLALFGPTAASAFGVYRHDHDHTHDLTGQALPLQDQGHYHGHNHGPGHNHHHGREDS